MLPAAVPNAIGTARIDSLKIRSCWMRIRSNHGYAAVHALRPLLFFCNNLAFNYIRHYNLGPCYDRLVELYIFPDDGIPRSYDLKC